MALICSQVACAEMEQGRVRGEDLDVYSMGGELRSKRREERNGCWQILFKKQTNAGTPKPAWHSPTTVTEICAVSDFLSTVMTQVHWPLCWLVTFTLRVPCIIFSPCGFSQCISSFWWEFERSAWHTRVTVCPGSTGDDGSADTRGGEKQSGKDEKQASFLFIFLFCSGFQNIRQVKALTGEKENFVGQYLLIHFTFVSPKVFSGDVFHNHRAVRQIHLSPVFSCKDKRLSALPSTILFICS